MERAFDMTREQACRALRPGLVLAATWRAVTELWRRHHAAHDLRLLQTHPGASERGQLCVLVGASPGRVMDCRRLVFNLGGPTGTFEVLNAGHVVHEGEFLWPALNSDPILLVDQMGSLLGLRSPDVLPPSTPGVLVMRLVAELLIATSLDREGLHVESAWLDWSAGVRVRPWAAHFGHDVSALQHGLDSGHADWQRVYLDVSSLLRLSTVRSDDQPEVEWLMDMQAGQVLRVDHGKTVEVIDVASAYALAGRHLEPLVARLLVALRGG